MDRTGTIVRGSRHSTVHQFDSGCYDDCQPVRTAEAVEFIWGPETLGCNCEPCVTDGPHWSDCAFHGVDTGDGVSYEGPCSCERNNDE